MFATSEQLLMEAQKCLESEKKRKLGILSDDKFLTCFWIRCFVFCWAGSFRLADVFFFDVFGGGSPKLLTTKKSGDFVFP